MFPGAGFDLDALAIKRAHPLTGIELHQASEPKADIFLILLLLTGLTTLLSHVRFRR